MANPDIRVRLSAEGVQEVIGALKKIQDQSAKIGGSKEVGLLGGAFRDLKELLPAVGIAAAVGGMISLGKGALQSADNMGKLAQKVGSTTEQLSVLALAATTADVEQDKLEGSLKKLAKAQDEAASGSTKQLDAFKRLGISMDEIKNQDPGEMFVTIAERIQKLPAGAQKAAVAMNLFGKAGADLMPLLDDLADGGFDKVREKAEKMGLVIDGDLAQAAQRANDSLTEMGNIANGLATRFMSGFAPAIADAMENFNEAVTGSGVDAMKELGEVTGDVIKGIVAGFLIAGKTIGAVIAQIENAVHHAKDGAKDLGAGTVNLLKNALPLGRLIPNLKGADASSEYGQAKNAIFDQLGGDINDVLAKLFPEKKAGAGASTRKPGGNGGGGDGNLTAIAQARAAFLKAQADNELALTRTKNKLLEDENKRDYENGLVSLEDYFNKREALAKDNAAAELKDLQVKLDATKAEPADDTASQIKKAQEVAAIQTQIAQKRLELEGELKDLAQQREDEEKKHALDMLDLEQQIADLEGDRWTAAQLALAKQLEQMDEMLKKQGLSDSARADALAKIGTRGQQNIDFNKLSEQGRGAINDVQAKQADLQDQVAHGLLFQTQADEKLIEYEKTRLAGLQATADQMMVIAQASGDPAMIESARQFAEQVKQISVNTDEAGRELAQLKGAAQDALTSGLTDFFTNGIKQAENFGEAVRGLALSVIDSLEAMAAQVVATELVKKLFSSFGMGGGGGDSGAQIATAAAAGAAYAAPVTAAGAVLTAGGTTILTGAAALSVSAAQLQAAASTLLIANSMSAGAGFAEGGLVAGPGTGTSDSIPARLSDGEFVVKSNIVSQPGMLAHLSSLNRSGMIPRRVSGVPRFAEGGLVSTGGSDAAATKGIGLDIGLDEGLILKRITAHPDFDRAVVRSAGKNRNSMNQALGGR